MQTNILTMTQFFTQPLPAATGEKTFHQAASGAQSIPVQQGLVFIIMSFDGMNDVQDAIRKQCSLLGLTAKRADDMVGGGVVMQEVDRLIRQAELIICDLSHERPNVYYELGYAHGAGNLAKNTLLIAKKGTNFHFDVAQLHIHCYSTIDELCTRLATKLPLLIQEARHKPTTDGSPQPNDPVQRTARE